MSENDSLFRAAALSRVLSKEDIAVLWDAPHVTDPTRSVIVSHERLRMERDGAVETIDRLQRQISKTLKRLDTEVAIIGDTWVLRDARNTLRKLIPQPTGEPQ